MRIGALLGPVVQPQDHRFLANQAKRYAAEGFSSLWSAQAIGRGFMMTDPFVALSVAATATDGLELGTAVLQVPLYHPMDLAHRVFSLQRLCGDRFIFGVGAGSTQQDFDAYARPHDSRFRDFRNALVDLRQIFKAGGLGDAQLSPWPSVAGGPPIFLGSWGNGVEQAARSFDGWIASANYRSVDEVCAAMARYRAAGGGRAIVSTIQISGDTDLGELKEKLARFSAAGFDDAVVMCLPGAPAPAEVVKLLP